MRMRMRQRLRVEGKAGRDVERICVEGHTYIYIEGVGARGGEKGREGSV
jgi:hypothetical protein